MKTKEFIEQLSKLIDEFNKDTGLIITDIDLTPIINKNYRGGEYIEDLIRTEIEIKVKKLL